MKYETDIKVSKFLNLMLEHNLHPCITEPTRIIETNKPSLVDNIFIKNINDPICGNILEKISYDHLPNFILFESEKSPHKVKTIKTRDMQNFNLENFLYDLNSLYLKNEPHLSTMEMSSLSPKLFIGIK